MTRDAHALYEPFGFVRRAADGRAAVVLVPRLVAGFSSSDKMWRDTRVQLGGLDGQQLSNVMTGETLAVAGGGAAAGELLATLPVAVLVTEA